MRAAFSGLFRTLPGSFRQQTGNSRRVVFSILNSSVCSECGAELGRGSFLRMEKQKPLCTECADLDHLVFLPSAMSRWEIEASPPCSVMGIRRVHLVSLRTIHAVRKFALQTDPNCREFPQKIYKKICFKNRRRAKTVHGKKPGQRSFFFAR